MSDARLEVHDGQGRRVFPIEKVSITIGRRTENDIRLTGSDVSRDHAEIVEQDGSYLLRDRGSRYGTFVNDTQITEHRLVSGDRIQFGRAAGTEVVFMTGEAPMPSDRAPVTAVSDLRQLAVLLEGLRALGSGRVLDDVLALVLDAAIEVTGAERGFIMLAGAAGLDMKLARARGRITLPGNRFDTSRKIPEEVFATGEVKVVPDLLDATLSNNHQGTVALGIRHVACAPLRIVRYLDRADQLSETRSIGVLYLDSRERGTLTAPNTKSALDTLATEAGVAIENARLYRETLEKARIEHELRIAAEIQRALLPEGTHNGPFYEASGTSVSARTIGGDFYDQIEMADGSFAFLLGDVSGKGPAAALLTSKILGIFSAFASVGGPPAETIARLNHVLTRRAIGARYATTIYGRLLNDGTLEFCSAGHNPALVFGQGGLRRLDAGGMPVGLFESAEYSQTRVALKAGDTLVMYSDGVTEAQNLAGEEFGETRLVDVVEQNHGKPADELLSLVVSAVQQFAHGAEQSDDITALIVRYTGPEPAA
jgi:serine phosphatase RsbU (regulator of sigma subunit)/pSer/pThr/pTyr-binding forkhead associated (FHA) protein